MKKLLILDGHALLFRAFHAMPDFRTPDGRPSGAVHGFVNVVIRLLKELEPTWVIACFDSPGKTFRDEQYPEYKATRSETPEGIITQEPMVKEALETLAIPHYAQSGFEADDLIGTLVTQADTLPNEIEEIIVATGDRDLLQLANQRIKIYLIRQGIKDIELFDGSAVEKLIGVPPAQLLDWKALRGDTSDNIPGVPGVGDKTALSLIKGFNSLERLYEALGDPVLPQGVTSKLKETLLTYKDRAFTNRELLTINRASPITLDLIAADRSTYDPVRAIDLLKTFGFKSILTRLPGYRDSLANGQTSLFG